MWKTILLGVALISAGTSLSDTYNQPIPRDQASVLQEALNVAETNSLLAMKRLEQGLDDADDPHAALFLALGNLYFDRNLPGEAADIYREALKRDTQLAAARRNLARAHVVLEQYEEALQDLSRLVRDGQAAAEDLLLMGHAAVFLDRWMTAETAYRQALLMRTESVQARGGLARALAHQDRVKEALALVEELTQLQPNESAWWALQADLYLRMNQTKEALTALETAWRFRVATPDMVKLSSHLYLRSGALEPAVQRFVQWLNRQDKPELGEWINLTRHLVTSGYEEDARTFIDLLKENEDRIVDRPDRQAWRLTQAEWARRQGRPREAEDLYRKVLADDPLHAGALFGLGRLYRDADRPSDALIWFERAGRLEGHAADALAQQALCMVDLGRYAKAVELLESAQAEQFSKNVESYLRVLKKRIE